MSSTARILRPIILCLLLAGAAGCGYKGPLYLPEAPPGETPATAPEEVGPERDPAQDPEQGKEQDEDRDDTAAARPPAAA